MRLRPDVVAVAVTAAKVAVSVPALPSSATLTPITWFAVAAFCGVGLILLRSGMPDRNGWLCMAVAAATIPGDLDSAFYARAWLSPVGYVFEFGYLVVAVLLVQQFPHQRRDRVGSALVAGLAVTSMLVRVPLLFVAGRSPDGFVQPPGWPRLQGQTWLHDWVLLRGGHVMTAVLLAVVAVRLIVRSRGVTGLARRAQVPILVVTALCAAAAATDQLSWVSGRTEEYSWIPAMARNLCAVGIPVALLAGLLRRRSAGAAIAYHVVAAAQSGTLADLQSSLRAALEDPVLRVCAATPDGRWFDDAGDPCGAAGPDDRVEVLADENGRPMCIVAFGPGRDDDEMLVEAAVSAARLGLSNTRLTADLAGRTEQLARAQGRVAEAGQQARKQVERDLHDGAQQQLLAVMATLARADLVPGEELLAVVSDARQLLTSALKDLRSLSRGEVGVSGAGLGRALTAMCDAIPIPATATVDPRVAGAGVPDEIAHAVYLCATECVANSLRHSAAGRIRIELALRDGALRLVVDDDGLGGAQMRPGGGLEGLQRRVADLGGCLELGAAHGAGVPSAGGTVVAVAVPLTGPSETAPPVLRPVIEGTAS